LQNASYFVQGKKTRSSCTGSDLDLVKQIQLVIKPFKLDEIKEALEKEKIQRLTFVDVRGGGSQLGRLTQYRGVEYIEDIAEVKVEIIAEDDEAERVTNAILRTLRTGALCDGEIAIFPLDRLIHVRIGKV
jgi:nitrogen regulatory protein P-II 1